MSTDAPVDGASHNLERQSGIVASMTMTSRVSGFVRDMVLSGFFGATPVADAFFVAFRIPNFFRRLFAEGAFSQAFVPVLANYRTREPEQEMRRFVAVMSGNFGTVMITISLFGVVAAPLFVLLFAPGFHDEPARAALTGAMLRATFPYLGFISLTAFAGAVLNSFHRFAIPAFTPVWLNLTLIAAALIAAPAFATPVMALAWGVFAAGSIQLLFQIPALRGVGMLLPPRVDFSHPGVRRVTALMVPAVFAGSVSQINALVDTMIASLLMPGSISWLYYSDRLMELPIGVIAVTIATVLLPNLSRLHAGAERTAFAGTFEWGIKVCLIFGVPAAAALYVLSIPLMATIFLHGAMTVQDARMASLSLDAFAAGLVGFALVKVAAPAYFSREDTRTPFRIAVVAVLVNIALSLASYRWMGHVGVAFATATAAIVQSYLLLRGVIVSDVYRPSASLGASIARTLLATAVMVALLKLLAPPAASWLVAPILARAAWLAGLATMGLVAYAATLWLLGVRPRHLRHTA